MLCRRADRADDIVQSAATRLYNAVAARSGGGQLDAYVRRTVVNTFLSGLAGAHAEHKAAATLQALRTATTTWRHPYAARHQPACRRDPLHR